jgi:hypothetical protein
MYNINRSIINKNVVIVNSMNLFTVLRQQWTYRNVKDSKLIIVKKLVVI